MGTINYTTECGPDGSTIVEFDVSNGYLTVYIDGIEGHMLVTTPGTHVIEWWGYPTSNGVRVPGPDVLWDTKTVTVAALTDCAAPPTTIAAPPTSAEVATSTTVTVAPAPSTTAPPDIGIDTTVVVTSNTLPATATSSTAPLVGAASAFLVAGVVLVLIKRRGQRNTRRLIKARLVNEVQ